MGILRGHAAARRDRAAARLLNEETRILRAKRLQREGALTPVPGVPWWRQPTLGQAIMLGVTRKREAAKVNPDA